MGRSPLEVAVAAVLAAGVLAAVAVLPLSASAAPAAATSTRSSPLFSPAGPAAGDGRATSQNWSGFVAESSKPFTQVVGHWVEPTVTCSPAVATSAAFWVGLDGYTDETVEQIGTKANCTSGAPGAVAWWQMYPAPKVMLSRTTDPVRPGDTLTASVVRSGTTYALSLQSSAGWSFSTTQSAVATDASAEWVASSPPLCPTCGFAPLADFATMTFSGAQAAVGGALRPISSFTAAGGPLRETMLGSGGMTRARPGVLRSGGTAFDDTWVHR